MPDLGTDFDLLYHAAEHLIRGANVVAAGLIPSLGFLLTAKPNIGLALWLARPTHRAVVSGLMVVLFSLIILPSWPLDWLRALQTDNQDLRPPIFRPFGFLLLLTAFRWRSPGGALLLALALTPQNTLPHELVPLTLIPGNLVEMGSTWRGFIALAITAVAMDRMTPFMEMVATLWPTMLVAVYLPMLYTSSCAGPIRRQRDDLSGYHDPGCRSGLYPPQLQGRLSHGFVGVT